MALIKAPLWNEYKRKITRPNIIKLGNSLKTVGNLFSAKRKKIKNLQAKGGGSKAVCNFIKQNQGQNLI